MIAPSRWQWIAILLLASVAARSTAAEVEVYFSPGGDVSSKITTAIQNAQSSIRVAAYAISDQKIVAGLVAAKLRGIDVQVIVCRNQESAAWSKAKALHFAGVPTWTDPHHLSFHNKYLAIDGNLVITGSANFTAAANTSNAENVVFIHDKPTCSRFLDNWTTHVNHSRPFRPPGSASNLNTTPRDPRFTPKQPPTMKGPSQWLS